MEIRDIRRVFSLFSDLKRSTQALLEFNQQYMFNELQTDAQESKEVSDDITMEA